MNLQNKAILLATSALGLAYSLPAAAQAAGASSADAGNDIVVTARRTEEKLQDVPISITVLNQTQLANNNITSTKDLAQFTPGLAVNNRYGADNTVFTIRGFYQEQRSTATVGVYFADVVAPRGSGATFGGDGAGAGSLFDLNHVEVLKGPQGTLQGRNSTGGAILLVPNKPTDKFEGYVEGGAGDYSMWRAQAVLNVPVSETFKLRLGVDHQQRDGYLKNVGNFGDGAFGNHGMADVNYWAARVSAVWDITPDIENYTVGSWSHSQNNGVQYKIIQAFAPASNPTCLPKTTTANFGCESAAQIAREAPFGFWSVSNRLPDAQTLTNTWQVTNATTWKASDSLTVKNIVSFAELRGKTNVDLFGNYAVFPGVTYGTETPAQVNGFAFTHANATTDHTNAQKTFIEELRFQGVAADGRFNWQGGGYMELSDPLGLSGVQTASFTPCTSIQTLVCDPITTGSGVGGTGSYSLNSTKFRDYAFYAQGTYKLTDQLSLTGGFRYTWDEMKVFLINETSLFNANPANTTFACTNLTAPGFIAPISGFDPRPANTNNANIPLGQQLSRCQQNLVQKSHAPTWLVDLDWKPNADTLLYAKWSRGYRQGGIAIFGPDPAQFYGPEKVDTYEVGAKLGWRGSMPGYFNVSGYYNDFRNQQLQLGVSCVPTLPNFTGGCAGNATIINAGKSRIYGLEAELNVSPFEGMHIDVSYAYINARQLEVTVPNPFVAPYNAFTAPLVNSGGKSCAGEMCDTIANSGPPHQLVITAAYTLPTSASVGKITLGGSMTYQSRRRIVSDGVVTRADGSVLALAQQASDGTVTTSGAGVAPSSTVLNLNVTWENIASTPIDVGFFVTNVTNEHVIQQLNDNTTRGFISALVGEPRMFGFRVKYHFGQ